MKKAVSDTGTIHLFDDQDVRDGFARGGGKAVESLCGSFTTRDAVTAAPEDTLSEMDALCENCADVVGVSDDE